MDYMITFSDVMATVITLGLGVIGFFMKRWISDVEQGNKALQQALENTTDSLNEKIEQGNRDIQEKIQKNDEKVNERINKLEKKVRTSSISSRRSMISRVTLLQPSCSVRISFGQ